MEINTVPFLVGAGVVLAVAATVLSCIFILPEKKREKLPKILKIVHDILNFKSLVIEQVLRVLYVLVTAACIIIGLLMIFGIQVYDGYYNTYTNWYGGYGILLAIVGPIVARLVFEGLMMFILLVKNTIQINNKIKGENGEDLKTVEVTSEE